MLTSTYKMPKPMKRELLRHSFFDVALSRDRFVRSESVGKGCERKRLSNHELSQQPPFSMMANFLRNPVCRQFVVD